MEEIRELRESLRLKQHEFAERVNISTSYLSNIERGTKTASFKLLKRIKETFSLSNDWLLDVTGNKSLEDKEENITQTNDAIVVNIKGAQISISKQNDEININIKNL